MVSMTPRTMNQDIHRYYCTVQMLNINLIVKLTAMASDESHVCVSCEFRPPRVFCVLIGGEDGVEDTLV